ncbi:MAG: AGE family epimerase/isomerase [Alphaproteobacteria bacterium]
MTIDTAAIAHWLYDLALPLWSGAGRDLERGGFVECLTLAGKPDLSVPKRCRVQARQMYVYSHAAILGWQGPALESARAGFEFLTQHYWDENNGGWIFSVTCEGEPQEGRREAYEQAFCLMALAWYYRASGDNSALEWIDRTLAFLDNSLGDPVHGGYREAVPDALPRRQNPHMHLLEALLALHEATGQPDALTRAGHLIALFRRHFLDAETDTLGEFYTSDWQPAAGVAGQLVEPGHHFEWVWLLHQYGRLSGDDYSAEAARLYRFAEAHGVDQDGLSYDAVRRDGAIHDDNKRLWVQTEAIKAQVARHEFAQDEGAQARLAVLLDGLFAHYLDTGLGCWQDHLARNRRGFAETAPASSFYHVFLALIEVMRVFGAPR